jgi:hypothetical protein
MAEHRLTLQLAGQILRSSSDSLGIRSDREKRRSPMKKSFVNWTTALALAGLVTAGCGTATGAAVGAAGGAAIGAGTGYGAGKGALIGTGVGAAAGAIYDFTHK